jgi:putative phosphoesterase
MKVGVLSDTHLNRVTTSLRRIYERHLAELDAVLHAGDVVSIEVVRFLDHGNFYGVHGNMDPPEVRQILPPLRVFELGGWRIGLTHGGGNPSLLEKRIEHLFSDVDIVVYGHSHVPVCHMRSETLFINPGSATGLSRSGSNTIGILELGERISGEIIEIYD